MKPLFYLAGPITKPDPMVNTAEALRIGAQIMATYPVVLFMPQLSVYEQAIVPRSHREWLDYDLHVIANCKGILRIEGESVGADMEARFARTLGIPVFELDSRALPPIRFDKFLKMLGAYSATEAFEAVANDVQAWGDEQYASLYGEKR